MAVPASNTRTDVTNLQNAQETAVGVSVYVQPNYPGFRCTFKQRYTDFLVNEILPNGDVLHLSEDVMEQDRKRKREEDDSAARKKPRAKDGQDTMENVDATIKDKGIAAPEGGTEAMSSESGIKVSDDSIQAIKEKATASISEADKTTLNAIFGEHTSSSILNLYASVVAYPTRKPRDHITVNSEPFTEKARRTEAHVCVRRVFCSKLETLTVQDQDSTLPGSIISIKAAPPQSASASNGSNRNGEGQRGKQNWADLGGDYLHFTLYKENKDTMEVLYFLASQLKMHMKHFSFAGTKDRRGVTVQRVAIYRVKRERIEHLNRLARGWRLGGPWEYRPDGLDLGMLSGNQFLITLRDAHCDGDEINWSIHRRLEHAKQLATVSARNLSNSGFLNYYGLQRFGSYATGTHVVGMRMLKGDLRGAVDAILSYDLCLLDADNTEERKIPHDDIARAHGIHAFLTSGSSTDALAKIPSRFSAERSLVTHLGKTDRKNNTNPNANDFQGGLMSIQRNLRLMYVHAYQSFVWNTVVGKRWELYADHVAEGDLVVIGEKEDPSNGVTNGSSTPVQEVDQDGEPVFHPSASAPSGKDEDRSMAVAGGVPDDPYVRARPLTKTEAESGRYNVFDLVLPLPGYDVLYPNNDLGKFYEDFMSSEAGGGLDPHSMRRAWKDISLSGGYRKMMARPLGNGVEVDVKAYSAPDEQLVQTDLERLLNTQEASISGDQPNGTESKDKLAVILKLQLGSSQYATMALRELTKGGAVFACCAAQAENQ